MNFAATLDRAAFFAAIRPHFGGRLNDAQVAGMGAILDVSGEVGMTDAHHVANVLAQVRHETGGHMAPIKETVMPSHKDKNPSDATVIQRLDKAYASGKLPWVKAPYWRDGWFGRGPVQVTHKRNYEKVGKAIGVDLIESPGLALDTRIGAMIAVIGMRDGLFTGKKLADYAFPSALSATGKLSPRRIINGIDGTDLDVAKFHRQFHAALEKAGWGSAPWPDHVREPATAKPVVVTEAPHEARQTGAASAAPVLIGGGIVAAVVTWWGEITATVAGWIDALPFWN